MTRRTLVEESVAFAKERARVPFVIDVEPKNEPM
jgi:hypothetical protein